MKVLAGALGGAISVWETAIITIPRVLGRVEILTHLARRGSG